eukprot:8687142-Pyramimonas_sp.AAC.1
MEKNGARRSKRNILSPPWGATSHSGPTTSHLPKEEANKRSEHVQETGNISAKRLHLNRASGSELAQDRNDALAEACVAASGCTRALTG